MPAVRDNHELREFFINLTTNYLTKGGEIARIDILNCPLSQSQDGVQVLQALSQLLRVPVYASDDIWGAELSQSEVGVASDVGSIRIGTLYFDGHRLKDWSIHTPQTLDKYEKIKTVGKGEVFIYNSLLTILFFVLIHRCIW